MNEKEFSIYESRIEEQEFEDILDAGRSAGTNR